MTAPRQITAAISPGDLLDKITILEIKLQRIADHNKLANVQVEYDTLLATWTGFLKDLDPRQQENLSKLQESLLGVNQRIWDIEDGIRGKERDKSFDKGFIELARGVYINNDIRASVKKTINTICDSVIVEEKSYEKY